MVRTGAASKTNYYKYCPSFVQDYVIVIGFTLAMSITVANTVTGCLLPQLVIAQQHQQTP